MRQPKNPRKYYKAKADKLFSQLIRRIGYCKWCLMERRPAELQCAHIYSRRFLVTRWDKLNALALCPGCHRRAHDKPLEFAEFVSRLLGGEQYLELMRAAKSGLRKVDFAAVVESLQAELKEKGGK